MADIKKVHGPYFRKDGRMQVCIVYWNGEKQTKSYPRYLLEQKLGRELRDGETVDHIDENFRNNDLSNLQVLTLVDNVKKSMLLRPANYYYFVCPQCGSEAVKRMNQVLGNWKKGEDWTLL